MGDTHKLRDKHGRCARMTRTNHVSSLSTCPPRDCQDIGTLKPALASQTRAVLGDVAWYPRSAGKLQQHQSFSAPKSVPKLSAFGQKLPQLLWTQRVAGKRRFSIREIFLQSPREVRMWTIQNTHLLKGSGPPNTAQKLAGDIGHQLQERMRIEISSRPALSIPFTYAALHCGKAMRVQGLHETC